MNLRKEIKKVIREEDVKNPPDSFFTKAILKCAKSGIGEFLNTFLSEDCELANLRT